MLHRSGLPFSTPPRCTHTAVRSSHVSLNTGPSILVGGRKSRLCYLSLLQQPFTFRVAAVTCWRFGQVPVGAESQLPLTYPSDCLHAAGVEEGGGPPSEERRLPPSCSARRSEGRAFRVSQSALALVPCCRRSVEKTSPVLSLKATCQIARARLILRDGRDSDGPVFS